MNTLEKVKEWHKTFGVPISDTINIKNKNLNCLRIALLQEELTELKLALHTGCAKEVLDALTDLQYVLDGSYLSLGFHEVKNEAFEEIHKSNMSKMTKDGAVSKRRDGKILKGPDFKEPNLDPILDKI